MNKEELINKCIEGVGAMKLKINARGRYFLKQEILKMMKPNEIIKRGGIEKLVNDFVAMNQEAYVITGDVSKSGETSSITMSKNHFNRPEREWKVREIHIKTGTVKDFVIKAYTSKKMLKQLSAHYGVTTIKHGNYRTIGVPGVRIFVC